MNYPPFNTERFWNKVNKTDNCWLWTASKTTAGYGCFKLNGKLESAHILSYCLEYGEKPDELWVLHKCDTPSCVNPEHLFLGTRSDNMKDCHKKGRLANNLKPKTKLNSEQVKQLRELYKSGKYIQKEIAHMFGIDEIHCNKIINYKRWKNVD